MAISNICNVTAASGRPRMLYDSWLAIQQGQLIAVLRQSQFSALQQFRMHGGGYMAGIISEVAKSRRLCRTAPCVVARLPQIRRGVGGPAVITWRLGGSEQRAQQQGAACSAANLRRRCRLRQVPNPIDSALQLHASRVWTCSIPIVSLLPDS